MDAEKIRLLSDNGIDFVEGVDRFGGNEEMFLKFMCRYPADPHFAGLTAALEKGDCEAGFREAHTLKGVVGNLSFTGYFEVISPVAELLRTGKLEEAKSLMPSISTAQEKVLEAIEAVQ